MLIFAFEKSLQLRNRLTAKLTTRVEVRFICSSHRLPHLKPYSNILYKASCRKRHWKCGNKDRIQCSPLLRHRLNFLDCPAAWNGLHPLHSTSHYSECSFNAQRAGPVTCASSDSTLECGSLRVDHCQPCASGDSGYCGDAGLRWLNKTSPAVVVNQRAAEHNFTPVRSSTTAYCSGWVQQQQPPPLLLLPHNMDPAVEEQWQNSLCFHITGKFFALYLKKKNVC